ncbi:HEAT repeat domain-containing protein [bacterium]|nr:HEAT repeat domain-containing protein [bacterium]
MTRWIGKRGLWGVVTGAAVAAGSVVVAAEPGDVVVFKEGNKDRKVTVTKVNKRADKSVEVHGKDAATGEAVVWVEGESNIPPAAPAGTKTPAPATPAVAKDAAAKDAGLPKAKARTDDPIGSAAAPMPETSTEKERRLFNGKLFGRDPAPAPAANPAMPQVAEAGEPKQKGGLLNRLFGKKTPAPVPAAMPGPAITTPTPPPPPPAPVTKSAPAVGGEPKVAAPTRPATTAPTVTPVPVVTPGAGVPVPMPLPTSRPPAADPVPTPSVPVPSVPVPVPLPTIPSVPPGAQSLRPGQPVHVILPVGYVPAEVAMADDLRPYAAALKDAPAPSVRLLAAKGLADGRHGSTDLVKALLFTATQHDPAATVRAGCIDHLVRLGYHHPDFVSHLRRLADGPEGEERDAARTGLGRLTPRTW